MSNSFNIKVKHLEHHPRRNKVISITVTHNTVSSNKSGDEWSVYKANNKKADMKINHCEQKSTKCTKSILQYLYIQY